MESPVSRGLFSPRTLVGHIGRLGFGRQGALAAARRAFPAAAHSPLYKIVSLLVGSLLIGTAVSLLRQAELGLSPYDVLVSGLQPKLGLSFGQTVWLISVVLFATAIVLGQRPSRWGVAYVFANGVAVDVVAEWVNAPGSLLGRVLFVVASVLALGAGISIVVHSGSTGGAFELLMTAGEVRGLDRTAVRTSLEVGVLVLGIVLGGDFGPATLALALTIGPVLGVVGRALEDHAKGRALRQIDAHPHSHHPSAVALARR